MASYNLGLLFLVLFLSASPRTLAVPISTPSVEESPPPVFALWLCIPFIILAIIKLTYMKFRRAESIHACDPGVSVESKSAVVPSRHGLGLRIPDPSRRTLFWNKDITGYLVGCFGSPDWETRIRRRVDRVVRKSKSIASTVTSPRVSLAGHRSSVSGDTRTSKGTSSGSRVNTTISSQRPSGRGSRCSGSHRSRSASVSFLEMQTPKVPDIINCGSVHPSSPACQNTALPLQHTSQGSLKPDEGQHWRRRRLSMSYFSPIILHIEPPPTPASPAEKRSLDKSTKSSSEESHSHSCSKTPSFQEASTSSNVSSESIASLPSGEITVNLSCSQAPSSPNLEASITSYPHSLSESMDEFSYIVGPDGSRSIEWSADSVEVMKVPRRNRTPGRTSGSAFPVVDTSSSPATAPLSLSVKADLATSPNLSSLDHNGSVKSKRSSRHIPASSTLSPAPVSRHSSSDPNSTRSRGLDPQTNLTPVKKDWILDDLLKDGKLDVDAVSDVLGLDLDFFDDPAPNSDSIFGGNMSQMSDTSPTRDGMGWGRAAQSANGSFELQLRTPGGPLSIIPEETEDIMEETLSRPGSNRWSKNSGELSTRYSKGSGNVGEATNVWLAT